MSLKHFFIASLFIAPQAFAAEDLGHDWQIFEMSLHPEAHEHKEDAEPPMEYSQTLFALSTRGHNTANAAGDQLLSALSTGVVKKDRTFVYQEEQADGTAAISIGCPPRTQISQDRSERLMHMLTQAPAHEQSSSAHVGRAYAQAVAGQKVSAHWQKAKDYALKKLSIL
jgi:hypothetical protein